MTIKKCNIFKSCSKTRRALARLSSEAYLIRRFSVWTKPTGGVSLNRQAVFGSFFGIKKNKKIDKLILFFLNKFLRISLNTNKMKKLKLDYQLYPRIKNPFGGWYDLRGTTWKTIDCSLRRKRTPKKEFFQDHEKIRSDSKLLKHK